MFFPLPSCPKSTQRTPALTCFCTDYFWPGRPLLWHFTLQDPVSPDRWPWQGACSSSVLCAGGLQSSASGHRAQDVAGAQALPPRVALGHRIRCGQSTKDLREVDHCFSSTRWLCCCGTVHCTQNSQFHGVLTKLSKSDRNFTIFVSSPRLDNVLSYSSSSLWHL